MKLRIRWWAGAFLAFLTAAPSAHAVYILGETPDPTYMHVSVEGGMVMAKPSSDGGLGGSNLGFNVAGNVLIGVSPIEVFQIETGFGYEARSIGFGTPPISFSINAPFIVIPLVFRLDPSPYFSGGLGGYYAIGQTVNVSGSSLPGSIPATNDYGILATVGGRLPLSRNFTLRLDAKAGYGFSDFAHGAGIYFITFSTLFGVMANF
ncbi:MAG: hypothetical protein ACXWP5_12620 [Bdellovibrionota bacterium]